MKNLAIQKRRQEEIAAAGKSSIGYYVFTSNTYRQMYRTGQRFHIQIYPQYDWSITYSDE